MAMPALTEPRPATTKSHWFVRRGWCPPKRLQRCVALFSESAPFVEQSICEASQYMPFLCFEVFDGEDSGPSSGQLICLGRSLPARDVVYGFSW